MNRSILNIKHKLNLLPKSAQLWFAFSWSAFALIGVPAYLLGHTELGHALSIMLCVGDCSVFAWALGHAT